MENFAKSITTISLFNSVKFLLTRTKTRQKNNHSAGPTVLESGRAHYRLYSYLLGGVD